MVGGQISIQFEMELVNDAIGALVRAHEQLARRHGEAFRRLERKIEELAEAHTDVGAMDMLRLEPGRFVVAPPAKLLELIAEARALGVL